MTRVGCPNDLRARGEKMGNTLKEDINRSLKYVRRSCRIISIIVLLMAALVAILWIMVICSGLFSNSSFKAESMIASTYTTLRDAVIIVALFLVSAVFSSAGQDMTPFGAKQTSRLRAVSVLLLILVVLDACFIVDYRGSLELLGSQLEIVVTTTSSLNVPALVLAAVAFCMSVIFRYGALLQEEEDALV